VYTCLACKIEISGETSFVQHCQGAKHIAKSKRKGFAGLAPNRGGVTPDVSDSLIRRCAESPNESGGGNGKKGKKGGGPAAAPVVDVGCSCMKCRFDRHRNPPSHFIPMDYSYCCSLCRMSNGAQHGGHCEKRLRTVPLFGHNGQVRIAFRGSKLVS
jgi:hypothetical protein